MNLVPQSLRVQIESSTVALPHVQRHILGGEDLLHGVLGRAHELGGQAQFPVGSEDGEGGYVAVALVALLLHLGQDVADDPTVIVFGDVE